MTEASIQDFLDLPFAYEVLGQELATLPEYHEGAIPGPTDYVVFVAAVRADPEQLAAFIGNAPGNRSQGGIQPHFLREWLAPAHKESLRTIDQEGTVDLTSHLRRKAKRALGRPAGDSDLVIYVEFVSP